MSDWTPFNALDSVLHQPTRLMIVTILRAVAEADFTYLLRETATTKGNLSNHLSKLEEAKVIEIEKTYRGKVPLTLCRLTKHGQKVLDEYMDSLGEVTTRLQQLRRARSRR